MFSFGFKKEGREPEICSRFHFLATPFSQLRVLRRPTRSECGGVIIGESGSIGYDPQSIYLRTNFCALNL